MKNLSIISIGLAVVSLVFSSIELFAATVWILLFASAVLALVALWIALYSKRKATLPVLAALVSVIASVIIWSWANTKPVASEPIFETEKVTDTLTIMDSQQKSEMEETLEKFEQELATDSLK